MNADRAATRLTYGCLITACIALPAFALGLMLGWWLA